MRFLIVSTSFPPSYVYGGPPMTAYGKAKALQQLGHDVLVVTTNANGNEDLESSAETVEEFQSVRVLRCARWHANPFFFAPHLSRILAVYAPRFDVALVQGNWSYVNWVAARVFVAFDLPFCLYPEGTFDPWAWHHHGSRKALYWRLVESENYQKASGVVALTDDEATQVTETMAHTRVRVIPNGVFLEEFNDDKIEATSLTATLAGHNGKIIVFVGRLHPKKGLDVLLHSFAVYSARDEQATLIIAGGGDKAYKQYLLQVVAELNLQTKVIFAGPVTGAAKVALLHRADVFALPSYSEGFSMAVLEAMACATPVLITPACHFPQVQQQGAGLIVEPDATAFAYGLSSILHNESARAQMGMQARSLIEEEFTWSRVAAKTVSFCHQLLE